MESFLVKNAIYVVLGVALIVWAGIAWYLTRLDSKVEALEKRIGK